MRGSSNGSLPNSLSSSPNLQVPNLLHLLLILLPIIRLAVILQAPLRLLTILDAVIKIVEQRLQRILEFATPIDRAASGSGRTSFVHPVHAISANQGIQRLRRFFDRLVEGFGGGVATFAEDFVLCEEHAVDATHQTAALAVEV